MRKLVFLATILVAGAFWVGGWVGRGRAGVVRSPSGVGRRFVGAGPPRFTVVATRAPVEAAAPAADQAALLARAKAYEAQVMRIVGQERESER